MKILLADPVGEGHHQEYAMLLSDGLKSLGMQIYFLGPSFLLNKLTSASLIEDGISIDQLKFGLNFFRNEYVRTQFYQESISTSEKIKAEICHFLYMDHFLISTLYGGILQSKKSAVCGTLHGMYFMPAFAPSKVHRLKGKVDLIALFFLASHGMRIMVHSENQAASLDVLSGTHQFDYVPYPVKNYKISNEEKINLRDQLRSRLSLTSQDVLLLVFGGTRFDKGADLAVRMLPHLPTNYHLLFAGRDTYFSRDYLACLAAKLGMTERVHFDNRFIPEDEILVYFCGCDIVLLPYRKSFSGQSGPMVIALSLGSKVVAPNLPMLSETVTENTLAWVYQVENVELMARAVQIAMNETRSPSSRRFYNEHCAAAFAGAVAASYSKARFPPE